MVEGVQLRAGTATLDLGSVGISRELDAQPFSILGTDFLERFNMSFDPGHGCVLLIPAGSINAEEVDTEYAGAAIRQAVELLFAEDQALLRLDVGERTIAQHLAKHLQRYFPGWSVDCEYNRLGNSSDAAKVIPETRHWRITPGEEPGERSVYPDIVVHHRGDEKANLLAIEVKKRGRADGQGDLEKLQFYKSSIGYPHAYFVGIPTGDRADQADCEIRRI